MASLCLLDDVGAIAQRWELDAQPLAVGRDESADVKINDASLSRRHFMILWEDENYVLTDLESENGTWVGGRRARAAAKLRHNECIVAGRTLFLYRELPFPARD